MNKMLTICAVLCAIQVFATPALDEATVVKHAAVARRAAGEGMVLLKNENGALPLAKGSAVALFGEYGDYRPGGGGSSNVKPVRTVDIPAGLAEAGFAISPETRETAVFVLVRKSGEGRDNTDEAFDLSAKELATLEDIKSKGFAKIVVVCNCGHAINLAPLKDDPAVGAILWTWYPGGEGGAAVGDVLSGAVNPSGRLSATFASRVSDWPSDKGWRESRWYVPYEDDIYVGYRAFETLPGLKDKVVYPFGYGLGYTDFKLEIAKETDIPEDPASPVTVYVKVTNTGKVAGKRSVLVYTSQEDGYTEHPAIELRTYAKTRLLAPGESETLTLSFQKSDLAYFDDDDASGHIGSWVLDKGRYSIYAGGSVRDVKLFGEWTENEATVISTPGFKLQPNMLAAKRGRTLPVTYPGFKADARNPKRKDVKGSGKAVTLFDVADGKATLDELVDALSFEDMLWLLYGHPKHDPSGTGSIGDLAKFGISAVQTCDGPAGVRRATPSTYFPCAALLAGTFDPVLIGEIGGVIGAEAAEVDFDLLLAPGLCIHRHPLCGRNFEYFSEDPLVSGVSASAYVKGVQAHGVGATVKHFAGNGREYVRRIEQDIVSERAMREIYLRGFERAIKEAKPWGVMTAYNGINGYNSGALYGLVTGILRDEWGFDGLVMTDWHTTAPLWREVSAGNDVKMPDDADGVSKPGTGLDAAREAFDHDYMPLAQMRQSARRVLELALKSRRFARERKEKVK